MCNNVIKHIDFHIISVLKNYLQTSFTFFENVMNELGWTICKIVLIVVSLKAIDSFFRKNSIKNLPEQKSLLPFINNLDVIFPKAKNWNQSPCIKFYQFSTYLGDVYQIRIGNQLIIVANSYESILKLWCGKNVKGNNSRPITHTFHNVLSKGIYTVGTTPYGDSYKRARKCVSEKVLCERRNKFYNSTVIDQSCNELILRLLKSMDPQTKTIKNDLVRETQYFHLKIALILTYGFKLIIENPAHKEIADTMIVVENEITKVRSHVQNVQDYLQLPLRFIWNLFSNSNNTSKELFISRKSYLSHFYAFSESNYDVLETNTNPNEKVKNEYAIRQSLMFDYFNGTKDKVSREEITSICLTMVSAGLDNMPLNFKYEIHQMVRHPKIWDTAYTELLNKYDNDPKKAWEECYQNVECNYVAAIVKETLRLFTVLPMALPRETTSNIIYDNILIPKGTKLFMNCWAGNHDPAKFQKPMEFIPERFLREDGSLDNTIKHLSFGIGCRMCLGNHLAFRELYLLTCKFLLMFEPGEKPENEGISLHPLKLNKFPESLAIEPMDFDICLKARNPLIFDKFAEY